MTHDYDDMEDLDRRNRSGFKLVALVVVFGLVALFGVSALIALLS